MSMNDLRAGWRTLLQEPGYSLVVVLGLGIGVGAALLLLGFVRYCWQYNADVPDVAQVFIVKQRYNVMPNAPTFDQAPMLLRAVAARLPGVQAAVAYLPSRPMDLLTARIDGQLRPVHSLTVTPGFAAMLGVRALEGDVQAALDQPGGFAITEDAALRLFGTVHALGRSMLVEGQVLHAGAILGRRALNTTIPFETLLGVRSVLAADVRDEMLGGTQGWWGKVLVRVHPDASLAALTTALQQAVDDAPALHQQGPEERQRLGRRKVMEISLAPLGRAYFDTDVESNFLSPAGDRANPAALAGFGAVAVLILALAAVNYVNLAAVRVLRRQRQVAMRKVLGASLRQIVLQLLAESLLVALAATGLGLLLAWLALPLFASLVNRPLDGIFTAAHIGAALLLGVVLGGLTAAYPAWIAIGVRPSQVLVGRADTESMQGARLRRALTILQVAAAMAFASGTLAVGLQTLYAMRASPGFDPAPLLVVDLPEAVKFSAQARAFVTALAALPDVQGVAIALDAVGRSRETMFGALKRPGAQNATMEIKRVSANFFEQYSIAPVAGRLFSARRDHEDDAEPLVLNAAAARALGFADPVQALGQTVLLNGGNGAAPAAAARRVVGIAPPLRLRSLRETVGPVAYELSTGGATLSVRTGAPARVEGAVLDLWPRYFPDALPKLQRAQAIMAANYADDARMARLLAMASGIALAIAAFGTYVLAAHTVRRRAREIVLRKLYGAGRAEIGRLVLRESAALTLVAALLALPLAAVAIERYLAGYAERAPGAYWSMALALGLTLTLTLAATWRHASLAMRMLPATRLAAFGDKGKPIAGLLASTVSPDATGFLAVWPDFFFRVDS